MAGEIGVEYATGQTNYYQLRNRTSGMIFYGSGFESFNSASGNLATYAFPLTEQSTCGHYVGNIPLNVPPGTYDVTAKNKVNAWFAITDPSIAAGQVEWNGVAAAPLADTSTSGQISYYLPTKMAAGQMVQNFQFNLVSSEDHITPFTSGIVSGQILRAGSVSYGPLQSGSYAENGLGTYTLTALTSGDLAATGATLRFQAANSVTGGLSDPLYIPLILQRSSGV